MPGVWFGLGVSVGGHLAVGGVNTMYAQLYNTDSYQNTITIESVRGRIGPGLGGGLGAKLLLVTGVDRPHQLQGYQDSGFDFAISLGGRWGAALKALGKSRSVMRIAERLSEVDGLAGRAISASSRLNPDEYGELVTRVRELSNLAEMDTNSGQPNVVGIDLPLPGALELSLFYEHGTWNVVGTSGHRGS